jgi:uncharacterized membrane protein
VWIFFCNKDTQKQNYCQSLKNKERRKEAAFPMKMFAVVTGLVVVLMVGFWLMYTGFRGMVASPTALGSELLVFLAGVVCLMAGLIAGVFLLRPEYET